MIATEEQKEADKAQVAGAARQLNFFGEYLRWLLRVLYAAGDRFYWDNGFSKAAALAYTSLLSLVPLLALGFGLLASFAISEQYVPGVREFLFKQFVPNAQAVDTVLRYLTDFSSAISSLNVLVIGVLIVTSLLLINSIENVLNEIWQVFEPRPIAHRIAIFCAILLLGPALLLSSYYFIKFRLEPFLLQVKPSAAIASLYQTLLPCLIDYIAFVLLYYLVPKATVRLTSALFGGFWAALLFNLAKAGFALYLAEFASYDKIYKTLAAIPISLFWLYLAWTIVLFGAELCYQAQYLLRSGRGWKRSVMSVGDGRLLLAVQSLVMIARAYSKGQKLPNEYEISEALGCSSVVLKPILDTLAKAGILIRGDSRRMPLTLLRSPDRILLDDVRSALTAGRDLVHFPEELRRLFGALAGIDHDASASLADILVEGQKSDE